MKALVCVVLLFVLFSFGTASDSDRYGLDVFMTKLFFCHNVPPEGPSAKMETDSHGEKLIEIERSLQEVQHSVQEKLMGFQQSLNDSIKQVEDSLAGRYVTLQNKLAELEQNQTLAKDDVIQELSSTQEKYESLQSTLMELENNITARDDSLHEIERSIKETMQNMNRSEAKLNEFKNLTLEKDNTLQEMMRNMTKIEDLSKVKLEELEANLNKLRNETEFMKKYSSIRTCKDVSSKQSGPYVIFLKNGQFKKVYCEQVAFGGGWIVFQYRFNGQVDFYRTWDEYRDGFGTIDGEFWLGLKYLHLLTSTRKHELMVEVKDYDGDYGYAKYGHFEIGSEAEKFALKIANYSGTAGDSMPKSEGTKFSTKGSDNDNRGGLHCAEHFKGAWWHNSCTASNLNGPYGNLSSPKAMTWSYLKDNNRGMAYSRMMLREID